jgi:rRNA maturation RNase YbeY
LEQSINFFSEALSFELDNEASISNWILSTIEEEGKIPGDINYIFCSDEYLRKMNVAHLNHDTFTDILTFNYCVDKLINSDIFISIERVKDNAVIYENSFDHELKRVIIHGILHLLGYDDRTEDDKLIMSAKEDFYLNLQ